MEGRKGREVFGRKVKEAVAWEEWRRVVEGAGEEGKEKEVAEAEAEKSEQEEADE